MDTPHSDLGKLIIIVAFVKLPRLLIPRPSKVPNKHHKNRTIRCRRCEQFVPRRLGQQTHRRAKQQRKDYEYADSIKSISVVIVHRRSRHRSVVACEISEVGNGRRAGQTVQRNNRNNEQYKNYKGDENVDENVNTGAAVERDVFVRGFGLQFGRAEKSLSTNVSLAIAISSFYWIVPVAAASWFETLFGGRGQLARAYSPRLRRTLPIRAR
jgi:hypothetical protein